MNRLGRTTLAKALSEWGVREAVKYKIELPVNEHERMLAGVDVVFQKFSKLAARIILAEPLDVLRVEFDREDGEKLQLHNGHSLTTSLARLIADEAATLDGPLFCTVHVDQHDLGRELGPVVVYDGWHRAAKWLARARGASGSRMCCKPREDEESASSTDHGGKVKSLIAAIYARKSSDRRWEGRA